MIYVVLKSHVSQLVVADDLVPIWDQGICNHHDDIG